MFGKKVTGLRYGTFSPKDTEAIEGPNQVSIPAKHPHFINEIYSPVDMAGQNLSLSTTKHAKAV